MEESKSFISRTVDYVYLSRVLLNNWLVILLAGILTAAIGFTYSVYFVTPEYKASTTMLVDLRNSVHDDLSYEQVNVAAKYVTTLAYVMKTNTVLDPVIEELELDETASSLASKIQVSTLDDTLLIRVGVKHSDPKVALKIVKTIGKIAPDVINQKITSGYITEIESPTVSAKPVTPNVARNTVFFGIAGIFLVVVIVFLINLFNNRIRSVDELQTTIDLPLLGVIPTLNTKKGKGAKA
ncbi:MAG: hypothetical protein IIX54_01945 [Clostridia bacterium]|nr:hypothetical protein [Clostridia bacterium]